MPVEKVKDPKTGKQKFRWGKSGKLYTRRIDAVKQGEAIQSKKSSTGMSEGGMAKSTKKTCPKCKGAGCAHCGGKGYHTGMNQGGVLKKNTMNKGIKALKKVAPAAAKKMGYKHGGMVKCGASNPSTQKGNN
tara:strand:+ start:1747 stop:2142 length:396 start_codon:yes stop_codon:yes gene_type:complete